MHQFRLATVTRRFGGPLKRTIQEVSRLGVKGIVLDARHEVGPDELSQTGRRQLLKALSEAGLAVAALDFPTRRAVHHLDQLDARLAAVRRTLEFAFQLSAPCVRLHVGRIPDESAAAERQRLVDVLNELARHANRVGAQPALITAGDDPERLAALLQDVTEGPVGVDFDPAAYAMAGRDPAEAFRALYDRIACVEGRDGQRDIDGGGRETALGRGEVDWLEMAALLAEAGFGHWIVVDRTGGDDPPGDITRALAYLRRIGSEC
jgi:sugar phosphate isomerase/epimerase